MAGSGYYALRFTAGRFKGGEFPLRPNREFTIGRGSEFDMVLDEDMVSRRHAKIATLHGQVVLQDLKSTNGTFVNGERVTLVRLKPGDKVLIGTNIMEVFETDRSQPGGAAATRELAATPGALSTQSNPPSEPSQPSLPSVRAARPTADIGRTEAAMPVLKLGLPVPPGAATVNPPLGPKATLVPAVPVRAQAVSQPPGSLVPVAPAPEPPPTRDAAQGISGRFPDDDVGLTDLIELFHVNRRTGVLVVNASDGTEGRLAIREGRLYHGTIQRPGGARPLPIDGTKAVFRVLTWPAGTFRLETKPPFPDADPEISLGTRELVIEALRQWDELRKYDAHLPSADKSLALRHPLEVRLAALSAEALDTLQLVLNHGAVAAVLDHSAASDLETWQDLLYLLQNGYIQVS